VRYFGLTIAMKNLLILALLIAVSFNASAETTDADLFEAINARLSYMEDVALYKAQKHLPIEDLERERTVIEKAKRSAAEQGLDPDSTEDFFKAQIAVAKAIQFRYRADFLLQPSLKEPKNLEKEIRPRLLSLGDQIMQQLAAYLEIHESLTPAQFADFDRAINVKYVTGSDKQFLFKALQKVERLPTNSAVGQN
jgi:chorismate mutase